MWIQTTAQAWGDDLFLPIDEETVRRLGLRVGQTVRFRIRRQHP